MDMTEREEKRQREANQNKTKQNKIQLKQNQKGGRSGRLPSAESTSVGAAVHIVQPTLSLTSE